MNFSYDTTLRTFPGLQLSAWQLPFFAFVFQQHHACGMQYYGLHGYRKSIGPIVLWEGGTCGKPYIFTAGHSINVQIKGIHLLERHPEQGFSFPIADLALPIVYDEVVQLTELLGAVQKRADIGHAGRTDTQFLPEFTPQGLCRRFARLNMSTRQGERSGYHLLGQHALLR